MKHAGRHIVEFSVDHPRLVIVLSIVISLALAAFFPKAVIDTDPKHMLPVSSPVRQYNDKVEKDFGLHADVIVLGIVNENGIANRETLSRIVAFTGKIQDIPGVIAVDVVSLSTIDDIESQGEDLVVHPVLRDIPGTDDELKDFRGTLLSNPLFVNRIVSGDGTATAIYVPIEPGANGKEIADRIRQILPTESSGDQYYLAGDPVARDTFGSQMFRQMGLFSPIAGLVLCIAVWLMFRSLMLVVANMAVAMIGIIWSMGILIGLGIPVHIMSSMIPVFLMAIATDSVHIFNEFAFRYGEARNKRQAVLETMSAVGGPIFFSDLTTAVGFAALATATIVPVRVFGLFVALGTLVILLMSFTLLPAILILLRENRIPRVPQAAGREANSHRGSHLFRLGIFCVRHAKKIALLTGALLIVSAVGMIQIKINNNMVHWFKSRSTVRIADRVMNEHLGGTSTGYLVIAGPSEGAMKDPAMLRNIEGLQRELEKDPMVGKTFSMVDYVKRINLVLHHKDLAFERLPDSAREIGQDLFLFEMSAKPTDLANVVDYPYQSANIFLWLKSWDAGVMRRIMATTDSYLTTHPMPGSATVRPAGIAYFNLVWSDEVLWSMIDSFLVGLVLVLMLLVVQTRSILWGLLMFVPLLVTIAVLYGVVGLVGKDFDMPVAVLSTLSLGLAVDFAIHFVARFRQRYRENPDLEKALVWTVARPGRGIFLNAILFGLGFAVMILADLTPYVTVGVFMAAIMLLSAVLSLVLLPGLIHLFQTVMIKGGKC